MNGSVPSFADRQAAGFNPRYNVASQAAGFNPRGRLSTLILIRPSSA
jgi:hypothetical protein